ncbi:MAG: D-alanyl-D-alanine carboxypeptidase [Oscillospiraceae bacterium]|nr:D-alanyl-D-alanine carboxypeptidase [Oscillospiraceae bacterium]
MKKTISWILCIIMIAFAAAPCALAEGENPLEIKAKAAVLMDASTGEVLYAFGEREKLYPASVTKIMPLLLFMEAIDSGRIALTDTVTTSPTAAGKGGSQIWLKEGETMTVDELLRATAIASANDACTALGEFIAGSEEGFVKMMNDRAAQLGMNDTHFVNCSGLDDDTTEHLTTAYDVALMSKALLAHERIRNYTTVWMDSLRGGETQLVNTNRLVRFYSGTTGLKTGTTAKAGHCLSASAERDGLHLIAVVMGAQNSTDRFEGAKAMLNWGFANFETVKPEIDPAAFTPVKVIRGTREQIIASVDEPSPITLKSGTKNNLETKVELAENVAAPVEKGQILGKVTVSAEGKVLAEYPLFAAEAVAKRTLLDMMKRMLAELTGSAAE